MTFRPDTFINEDPSIKEKVPFKCTTFQILTPPQGRATSLNSASSLDIFKWYYIQMLPLTSSNDVLLASYSNSTLHETELY